MEQIYYSFIGTLFAFAFRDVVNIVINLRELKKLQEKEQTAKDRNLPKPETANKGRTQR